MDGFLAFLISLVAWLPLVALKAWALEKVWNWYLPPALGLPELTFSAAVGVSLVSSFLTMSAAKSTFDDVQPAAVRAGVRTICYGVAYPAAVGVAWVYLQLWPLP